jgi:uncharacterized membrane protein YphA (DoxX/SURF4 family)
MASARLGLATSPKKPTPRFGLTDPGAKGTILNIAETAGRTLLGLGALGLGLISILYGDFAITWQPVPDWVSPRLPLAYASGALLMAAGATLVINRGARMGAAIIAVFLTLWALALHPQRLIDGVEAAWLAPAEVLAVAAGAWILFWNGAAPSALRSEAIRVGAICFGLMPPIFGVAHFLYIDITAGMIPAWIPWRVFWAWFTGFGHIAAGLSIVTGVIPRIGATLLALMFSGFVLFVHIPRVIADVSARFEWHLLSTATLLAGAAWIVASVFWRKQV